MGVSGYVKVYLVIDVYGEVSQVRILTSEPTGYGFEEAALKAVREWKFEPAKLGSFPVSQKTTEGVPFCSIRALCVFDYLCLRYRIIRFLPMISFQANALYDNGQYKEAVPFIGRQLMKGDTNLLRGFNLGNTLVQLQKNEVALVAYRRTVELP